MKVAAVLAAAVIALVALSLPADARPAGCPATRWCGCFMMHHQGKNDRSLWVARNWARVGSRADGPAAGVIVVWPNHVGIITGGSASSGWIVLSGNDGRRVRERVRSVVGAIAFRWP